MTNKQFQALIDRVQRLRKSYDDALAVAENEYINRYGNHPSDVDDDNWIDSLHMPCTERLTVEKLDQEARINPSLK
jgi:hypothetical protein